MQMLLSIFIFTSLHISSCTEFHLSTIDEPALQMKQQVRLLPVRVVIYLFICKGWRVYN